MRILIDGLVVIGVVSVVVLFVCLVHALRRGPVAACSFCDGSGEARAYEPGEEA